MLLPSFTGREGFTEAAPKILVDHSWIYGPLQPVWDSFARLSRGRNYSGMGSPLPLTYRDIVDEVARCPWPHKGQLERWLIALDDEFLSLMAKKAETQDVKAGTGRSSF